MKAYIVPISLSFFCIFLSFFPLRAEKVDVEKAEKIAQGFLQSKKNLYRQDTVHLNHAVTRRPFISKSAAPVPHIQDTLFYYVFDINDNAGFVIVAADDVVTPVLGFSTNGSYDEINLPPNFAGWMDNLQEEILFVISQNLPQTEKVKQQWEAYLNSDVSITSAVSPLILTTWNQDDPYWNQCPMLNGRRSFTGCGATVMAQIMKFHHHPVRGSGKSEAYYTRTFGMHIPTVDFAVNYDWENMLDSYLDSYTDLQATAVATLMYHCGVSLKMDYSPNASYSKTEDMPAALTTFFGYDKTIQTKYRVYYDNDSWEAMLMKQLDAGLPVIYRGGREDGHVFICDGYDNDTLFHFNWGWGGYADGWFVSSALNTDNGRFNTDQAMIINIKPDENGDAAYDITLYSTFLTSSAAVQHNTPFTVSARVMNIGQATFPGGSLGVALIDSVGRIVDIIGSNNIESLDNSYITFLTNITCIIPDSIPEGRYKLKAIIRSAGANWEIINGSSECPSAIDIQVGQIDDDNAKLSALIVNIGALSPAFNENTASYYLTVPDSVKSVEVMATPADSMATVEGTGIYALTEGYNYVNVFITARDGISKKWYIITVLRSPSPPNLTLSLNYIRFAYFPELKEFTITSNTRWTASINASWATVYPASGSNNGTIGIATTTNTSALSRTATVIVSSPDVPTQTITITQTPASEGQTWDLSPTMTANLTNGVLTIRTSKSEEMMPDFSSTTPWASPSWRIFSAIIDDGVSSIGDFTFKDCFALTTVTIPNSVTTIGNRAFEKCFSLTSVTIPNSVTTIGSEAFAECSALSSMTIPGSVTSIGSSAFANCSELTSVTIPNAVTTIESNTFSGCTALSSITIPAALTTIESNTFSGCSALSSITIPGNVTAIGDFAFNGCTGLETVTVAWPVPLPLSDTANVFSFDTSAATLYVPIRTKALYQIAPVWKDFETIVEYFPSGNEPMPAGSEASNPVVAWTQNDILHITGLQPGQSLSIYNLAGQLVYYNIVKDAEEQIPLLKRGMYIIVAGDSSVKVFY